MHEDAEIAALLEVTEPMATWEWPDPKSSGVSIVFTLGILMRSCNGKSPWRVELTRIHSTDGRDPWTAPWFRPDPFDPHFPFMPIARFIALANNGRLRKCLRQNE